MKKHKCPYCAKKYQSIKDYDKHMQKIHGLNPVEIKETTDDEKSEFVKQCEEMLSKKKQK